MIFLDIDSGFKYENCYEDIVCFSFCNCVLFVWSDYCCCRDELCCRRFVISD